MHNAHFLIFLTFLKSKMCFNVNFDDLNAKYLKHGWC